MEIINYVNIYIRQWITHITGQKAADSICTTILVGVEISDICTQPISFLHIPTDPSEARRS